MLGIRVPLSDYQESVCPNSRTCWLDDFCVDLSLRIVGGSYVKIPRHRTVAFLAVFRPQLNSSLSQPPIVSGNSFHVYFTDFLLVIGLSLITKMVGRDRLTEEHSWLSSLSISLQPWDIFLETSYPSYYLCWRSPNRESQEALISCHQPRLLSWPGGCSTWQETGRCLLCKLPTGIKKEDRWSHISDSSRRPGGETTIELIELLGVGLGFPIHLWLKLLQNFSHFSVRSLSPGTCLHLRFSRRSTRWVVSNQCKIQRGWLTYRDIMRNLFIESAFKDFLRLWFAFFWPPWGLLCGYRMLNSPRCWKKQM